MRLTGEWMVSEDAHQAFTKFLGVTRNQRMAPMTERFARDSHLTFLAYFTEIAKCKNLKQWQAKMLAVNIPEEAVLGVRTPIEAGRVLALKFMAKSPELPTADLAGRDKWITPELAAFLEE